MTEENAIRFGYGTSGIMGASVTNRGRLSLLKHAYENGIVHFDTAPLYGQGDAERVIGQFVADKREKLTIATKFGLLPRRFPSYLLPLKPVARFANRRIKQLKSRIQTSRRASINRVGDQFSQPALTSKPTAYTIDDLVSQLDSSLRKMKTDYVDYFLLHDCQIGHINDDVVRCLEQARDDGKVLKIGLATERFHADSILEKWPELGAVVQYGVEHFSKQCYRAPKESRLLISHSLFKVDLVTLQKSLSPYKSVLDKVVEEVGFRVLTMNEMISRFLICQASRHNPQGILLFSSSSSTRLKENIDAAQNQSLNEMLSDSILAILSSKA